VQWSPMCQNCRLASWEFWYLGIFYNRCLVQAENRWELFNFVIIIMWQFLDKESRYKIWLCCVIQNSIKWGVPAYTDRLQFLCLAWRTTCSTAVVKVTAVAMDTQDIGEAELALAINGSLTESSLWMRLAALCAVWRVVRGSSLRSWEFIGQ